MRWRAALVLLLLAAGLREAASGADEARRLLALRVDRVPETVDDALWERAVPRILLTDLDVASGRGTAVELRALHDGSRLAVRAGSRVHLVSLLEPKRDLRQPIRVDGVPREVELAKARAAFDFEAAAEGTAPAGFASERTGGGPAGVWQVLERREASSGKRVVAQTSADSTSYRFPVLVADAPAAKDLRVSARFRAISGNVDRAGGLVARYVDADHYYVVRANALEGNVRLYRVADGKREQIAGADVEVSAEAWHTLTLEVRGKRIVATYDGQVTLTAEDEAIASAGRGGLWTKADSVTWFDDLEVVALYDE